MKEKNVCRKNSNGKNLAQLQIDDNSSKNVPYAQNGIDQPIQLTKNADIGNPNTAPAQEPVNAVVANFDRSSGGAQYRHTPCIAGYDTPYKIHF